MPEYALAVFDADITPPFGHPLCGGWLPPVRSVGDPLRAIGLVLLGPSAPLVVCCLDWCELRNSAHADWRRRLAEVAGTTPDRVLLHTVHQHDAPLVDGAAQRLLEQYRAGYDLCDLGFLRLARERVAKALAEALIAPQPIDGVGASLARVDRVASTRRLLGEGGRVVKVRYSTEPDPEARAAAEGTIDPWLRAITFWSGDRPRAMLASYACHPMTRFGAGQVSADLPGAARRLFSQTYPDVPLLYCTGCAGDLAVGRYNDGGETARQALAERLATALRTAFTETERQPLRRVEVRSTKVLLPPKTDPANQRPALLRELETPDGNYTGRARAALAMSWLDRAEQPFDLPLLDVGPALLALLPGEPFVELQLAAQQLVGARSLLCAAYADCAPGYIPTAEAYEQGGYEPGEWCFVAPSAHGRLTDALAGLLTSRR